MSDRRGIKDAVSLPSEPAFLEPDQHSHNSSEPPHEEADMESCHSPGSDRHETRQLRFLLDDEEAHNILLRQSEEKERQRKTLRADPWRFAVAPIFSVLSISNAMQWIAFSPIVNEVRDYFNMSASQVNFLATTYVIAYVAIVFLSCKLYEMTGIKNGVLVAAVANALGATLKIVALYAWPNAALLYIAQVFNSFTEVLTIATPPLIANRWFPENERMVANTVMSAALNFGCGIGVLIPTFFVGPDKQEKHHFGNLFWFHFALCYTMLGFVIFLFPKKPRYSASFAADRQQAKEEERLKLLYNVMHRRGSKSADAAQTAEDDSADVNQRSVTPVEGGDGMTTSNLRVPMEKQRRAGGGDETASGALVKQPITPFGDDGGDQDVDTATISSSEREVEPVNVFSVLMDCLRQARHNYSFVLLMVAAAAELGLIWAVATVLPQMLTPYGISESISGWIGFLNLVLGTVVCPFMMPLVERFGRRYKLILCSLSVVLLANMVLLTLLLHFGPTSRGGDVELDNKYYVVVTFVCWGGVSGLCQNFMMPLMFEYIVELTFPMSESTSAPSLTWAACLSNFLLTLIFGAVLTDDPDEGKSLRVFIGSTVVTAIGSLALFFTKPMHKRRDYEDLKKEEQVRLAIEIGELQGNIRGSVRPGSSGE